MHRHIYQTQQIFMQFHDATTILSLLLLLLITAVVVVVVLPTISNNNDDPAVSGSYTVVFSAVFSRPTVFRC